MGTRSAAEQQQRQQQKKNVHKCMHAKPVDC